MTERSEQDGSPPATSALGDEPAKPESVTDAGAPGANSAGTPAADPNAATSDPPEQGSATTDPDAVSAGARSTRASRHRGRRRRGRKRRRSPWWELPLLVGFAVVLAILVKTFLIQPFYIPSGSMENTLHGCPGCSGDRILVNKPIYDLRDPHPGDIVVFHAPPGWDEEPASKPPSNPVLRVIRGFGQLIGFVPPDGLIIVKRVIAIGGQTVKGDSAGHVYISEHGPDGPWRRLHEPYVYENGPDSHAEFGPVTVPEGRLWVMGDHRNNSADSRYHCGAERGFGADCNPTTSTVPISEVIGKAVIIAWPPSRWRTLGTPPTFKQAAMAAGSAAPCAIAAFAIAPIYLRRRRRRSRRGR